MSKIASQLAYLAILAVLTDFSRAAASVIPEPPAPMVLYKIERRVTTDNWSGARQVLSEEAIGSDLQWDSKYTDARGTEQRTAQSHGTASEAKCSFIVECSISQTAANFIGWGGISMDTPVRVFIRGQPGTRYRLQTGYTAEAIATASPAESGPITATLNIPQLEGKAGRGSSGGPVSVEGGSAGPEIHTTQGAVSYPNPKYPLEPYCMAFEINPSQNVFYVVDSFDYQGGFLTGKVRASYAIQVEPLVPRISASPSKVDFSSVPVRTVVELPVSVKNTGDALLSFRIENPFPPFRLAKAPASYEIEPGGSEVLKIAFAPGVQDSGTQFSQHIRIESNDPVQPSIAIELAGFAETPKPIKFRKTKSNQWPRPPFTLSTQITFESSTGDIADLKGMQIWELLTARDCLLVNGQRTSPPLGCNQFTTRNVVYPSPWIRDDANPYPADKFPGVNFNWEPTALGPYFPWTTLKYGIFFDGHRFPPLQDLNLLHSNSYTVEQDYVWFADWNRDSTGCMKLSLLAHDTIVRSVERDPATLRWLGRIRSDLVGEVVFDVADIAVAQGGATPGPTLSDAPKVQPKLLGHSGETIQLVWILAGAVVAEAVDPKGPWSEIPGTRQQLGLSVRAEDSQHYFRLQR